MFPVTRILLGDDAPAATSGGSDASSVASSSAPDIGMAGGTDAGETTTETSTPTDSTQPDIGDVLLTDDDQGTDAPEAKDDGDGESEPAGGLDSAPAPTPLTGDAAIAAMLASAAPAPAATPAPVQAPAPVAAAPAPAPTPDVSAVVKGFADAVGLEATDPALKSFTDVLTNAQAEAQAARQQAQSIVQRQQLIQAQTLLETLDGYSPEVFGEFDGFTPDAKFGLTDQQYQRRVAVELEATNLFTKAKADGKPISVKAAMRAAVSKVASFYPKAADAAPAKPKPQASATAHAAGRSRSRSDPFAAAASKFFK